MTDINEQVAVKVLEWHMGRGMGWDCWLDDTGVIRAQVRDFNPSESIAQCFEYIIPKMAEKGIYLELVITDRRVRATFYFPVTCDVVGSCEIPDPTKAALAICEASRKAVKGQGE